MDEEGFVAKGRGKWSQKSVPKKGWVCYDIEDLGEPSRTCEMCESQSIRYVHHMENARYPESLAVGCVCAGHMEDNLSASKEREVSMRNRASKRKRWIGRKWKVSVKGNQYIESDGYRVVVREMNGKWGVTVAKIGTEEVSHSRRSTKSLDRAKIAGFDYVTKMLAK